MSIIDPVSKSQLVLTLIFQDLIQFHILIFVGIVVWYDRRVEIPDIVCSPQIVPVEKIFELYLRQKVNILEEKSTTNDAISEILELLFGVVFLLSEYVCVDSLSRRCQV